jgi:hypothetical protein
MFWSSRYSSYIDCHGGDEELKNKLLEEERVIQNSTESCSVANLPIHSSDDYEMNKVYNIYILYHFGCAIVFLH